MNMRWMTMAASLFLTLPLGAADTMTKESPQITPGRYMASVMPGINKEVGDRIEKSLGGVPGLKDVKAEYSDSSIHFTVKNGSKVPVTDIQKAVGKADADAVMTAPILEHSLTPTPGL